MRGVVDEAHIKDTAAAFPHFCGHFVGIGQQAFLDFLEHGKQRFLVAAPAEMHLSDLTHVNDFGMETATFAPELGRCRGCRHDGTFLNDHRHNVVLAVDGHIGRDAVRDIEIGDGVLAELVKELLLLRVGVPITFQQVDDFTWILEVVGNQFQLLFLEKFRKALFYAFASSHIGLPLLFFNHFFGDEALFKLLAPILAECCDLLQEIIPNWLIQRIFLIHPFFARMVRLRLLHEIGEGVAHTVGTHLNGEIISNPGPFRFDGVAVVELELVLAFQSAPVVLLQNGRRTPVIRVHKLAVDAMLAGGMLQMVRWNGGITYIINQTELFIKSKRLCEFGICIMVGLINLFTANNTVAIITAGPIAKELTEKYGVDPKRTASLLDTTSCCVQGMLPYGAQILVATGLTASVAAVSSFSVIKCLYYPVLMGIGILVSLLFTKNK